MDRIAADLVPGMAGPQVADLQNGLQLILERNILDLPAQEQADLARLLEAERRSRRYSDGTAKLVALFQERRGLPATGEVRADTAAALNEVLAGLGAFDDPPARTRTFVVAGTVADRDGGPYAALEIAVYQADDGVPVRLGRDLSDGAGRYTVRFENVTGAAALVVEATDGDRGLVAHSDRQPVAGPVTRVDLVADRPTPAVERHRVEGRIILDSGAPAGGLGVRLYRLGFGGRATRVADAATSAAGDYTLAYPADGPVLLEVRAAGPADQETTLSTPLTVPLGTPVLRVDLVAPAEVLPVEAEYRRLTAALAPAVGPLKNLATVRETAERRDLGTLNAATGWDARVIALAATAHRLEQDAAVGLGAEALYGLFRAGLPRDEQLLAQVEPKDVGVALTKLAGIGIITMTDGEITDFTGKFTTFAQRTRLAVTAPGSQTTYAELLAAAQVQDAGDVFAGVFLKHRGDGATLWKAARDAGVPDVAVSRLQWQGKLAFLAGNSGTVTEHLMSTLEGAPQAAGLPKALRSPVELVGQDLHDAEHWKAMVRGLAADDAALGALVPATYEGATVADRLDGYATDMARKIRISYPTEVVTRMVETDAIKLNGAKDATVKLLQAAVPQGFTMGATPVERFVSAGMVLPDGMAQADVDVAKQEIKKLQRVYQITPTNEAMPVLKELGLESAFDVTALGEREFHVAFTEKYRELYRRLPTGAETTLVWRKAQQVSSITYTIFGAAKKLDADPVVPVVSGQPARRSADRDGLRTALKGYPTMEELFGAMDFCECEHCRSVLGPAAYLVDLLQFVEAEPQARANFLADWAKRNGRSYVAMGFLDPYVALTTRRPDLPHIPLTCENTNVALPYIDVVNEILEYYVAHDGLTWGRGP